MKKDILCRPFAPEQIKTRPGQHGKTLSYVETHAVIARLNDGCDAWGFEIVKHEVMADEVIVVGKLTADGIVKMAFGGSNVTKDASGKEVSLADDLKAAASDCLKKAASLLGVGLELYGGAVSPSAPSVGPARPTAPTALTADGRRAPPEGDRLTARQLAAIHAAARRRGVGPSDLNALLADRLGKSGPQFLTKREASELLSEWSNGNGAHAA
ncbi:MAG: hypothetical protein HYV09_29310 [Deltaproteobacteria bacterium]|nr:hypothetical protein [Deltaproteobacteria bacterium]